MRTPNLILQNSDAEAAFIGIVLQHPQAWVEIGYLRPEDFTNTAFRAIWQLLLTKRAAITIEEVMTYLAGQTNELGQTLLIASGGREGLEQLLTNAKDPNMLDSLALTIQECAGNRRVRRALERGLRSFEPSDHPISLNDRVDQLIREVSTVAVGSQLNLDELKLGLDEWDHQFQWRLANPGKLSGIRTFFRDIDAKMLGGLHPGNFWVVASSPGEGKSIFVSEVARRVVTNPQDDGNRLKVALFGVEMSRDEIIGRLIQSMAALSGDKIAHPERITKEEMRRLLLAKQQILADVVPNLYYFGPNLVASIEHVTQMARVLVKQHGVKVIIVDYIQRLNSRARDKRTEEVSDITSRLKRMAAELEVVVIAISQITREASKHQHGRASMFDMADSAGVERDADYVTTLWRPSKHLEGKAQQLFANAALLELVKGRFRKETMCFLGFDGDMARFDDLTPQEVDKLSSKEAIAALKREAKPYENK